MARVILVWTLAPCLALSGCGGPSNPEGQSLTDWQRDLDGASPEGRRRAVEALQRVGLRAIPMFVVALGSADPAVRESAARALGRIGPMAVETVPALTHVVAHDPDRDVRVAAAETLGRMGDIARDAGPALTNTLAD